MAAFLDLIDNLPESEDRFAEAKAAQLNRYRTSPLGFRDVLGNVRRWERQGIAIDPRSWRFEQIQRADIDLILQFHREHTKDRHRLVSIVGDKSKIDMEALARSGVIIEMGLEDIFAY